MMAVVKGKKRWELLFHVLWAKAHCLGLFIVIATALSSTNAQTPAAHKIIPAAAQNAVAATTAARPSAMQMHNDRLAILVQERNETSERLQKTKASGDAAAIARLVADLAALDREIATVSREPIYEIKRSTPQNAAAKPASVAQATSSESQLSASEITYESWDIFKNFGRKGNQ